MLTQITGRDFGSYMQTNKFDSLMHSVYSSTVDSPNGNFVLSVLRQIYSTKIDFGNDDLYRSMEC